MSKEWGISPSAAMGRAAPGDTWSQKDRALAHALLRYEASLCSGCGQPLQESTSPGADQDRHRMHHQVEYDVHHLTCWGCEVKARNPAPEPTKGRRAISQQAQRTVVTRKDGPAAKN